MSRLPPLLVIVLAAGALAFGLVSAPSASSTAPGIGNVASFLEQCPTDDPMYAQIRSDFEIRREGVVVGDISCSEPISAMPIDQYTDELIAVQTLRAIYYMEGGRQVAYPWTSGSLYDWMKSKIGGIDVKANGSYCCSQFNGKWYVVIASETTWDRDFDRQWRGISDQISVVAHESRHVDGFAHVGYCPLFPDQPYGCDQTYDESNLSPYGIQWWLNAKWLAGELYVGFSCGSLQTTTTIANWHLQQATNEFAGRFVDNSPPTLSMPAQPGGVCQGSSQTPTPSATPSATTPTPTPAPTPAPTPSPTPTPTPSPSASPTPTPVPTPTPTPTPASPSPTPTPTPTPAASDAATVTASPVETATQLPTPTESGLPPLPAPTGTPAPTAEPTPRLPARANANCDGATDARDLVVMLRAAGGLDYKQPAGCAAPGQQVGGVVIGDVDCNGTFDVTDILALLRLLSGLSEGDCSP